MSDTVKKAEAKTQEAADKAETKVEKVANKAENTAEKVASKAENAAEKATDKAENVASKVANKAENAAEQVSEQLRSASNTAQTYFSALGTAGRTAFEGMVEVDKLILNKFGAAASETAEYGRDLFQARDINTALGMMTTFARKRLDKNVADTKEVLDLANARAQDAFDSFSAAK